jgi:hypothetical protein
MSILSFGDPNTTLTNAAQAMQAWQDAFARATAAGQLPTFAAAGAPLERQVGMNPIGSLPPPPNSHSVLP